MASISTPREICSHFHCCEEMRGGLVLGSWTGGASVFGLGSCWARRGNEPRRNRGTERKEGGVERRDGECGLVAVTRT
jgi:hypothetical protein